MQEFFEFSPQRNAAGGISAGPRKQSAFPATIREFDRASFSSMKKPGFAARRRQGWQARRSVTDRA
ncbi:MULTISPECIES: hypothetical protein [Rhizobium]|uniref:hypothetical protein n=1 Tax=Rhizobium TaxID=379 RepID=UPI001611F2C3|nr:MULTISPECIES: hypothetical protein [Rhizobium]MBB4294698.1 hypothetical protein [Rhizobium leguminosarum]MBB4418329.1 hypothetical protein [Rhizobium leguminosarum]MBB4433174.1 hypothetical protein [Rhizobium esperanzae]MBB4527250.1 hypothetical protein [Rhizobium leguminosarum]MBB5680298.1 hypothetical protein [Rhizobium leguminosarum]